MSTETIIWIALTLALLGVVNFYGAKHNKRVAQQIADFRAARAGWEVYVQQALVNPTLLAVDTGSRQITCGTLDDHIDVAWNDICRVEIESNNTALTTTNRGSQLLGGIVGNALLGPMGLLIGGMTGSSSTRQRVNDLTLKIIVEHPKRPTHRIIFFRKGGKGLNPKALRLRQPAERLDHFHALLLNAMRTVELDRAPAASISSDGDLEQRLARLWELHQAGALTSEEFAERKQRLLAAS